MEKTRPISLVIPVYNEVEVIEKVIRDFYDKVISKIDGAQFIIAEDGSNDGTKEVLKRLSEEIPIMLVMGDERKGYTRAVKDALKLPEHDIIFFSDSDGQQEPDDFWELIKYIDDYETFSKYLKVEVWADYMAPQDIQYLRSIKGCIGILVNKRDLLEGYPMKLTIIEDFLERFISDLKKDYANVIIHGSVISLRKMDTLKNPQQILSLPCTPYIRLISARKK